jgi:hypothetical protein
MYNGVGVSESTLRKILNEYTESKRREAEARATFVSTMAIQIKDWTSDFTAAQEAACTYKAPVFSFTPTPEAPKKIEVPEVSLRLKQPKTYFTLNIESE